MYFARNKLLEGICDENSGIHRYKKQLDNFAGVCMSFYVPAILYDLDFFFFGLLDMDFFS